MSRRKRTKSRQRKITPVPYTGFVAQPERREPTNNYSQPTSTVSTTTGLPEQQGQGSMMQGMLATKGAYDTIGDMYSGGKNLRKGMLSAGDWAEGAWDKVGDAYTGLTDWMTGTNTLRSLDQLPQGGTGLQHPSWDRVYDTYIRDAMKMGDIRTHLPSNVLASSGGGMSLGLGVEPWQNTANQWGLAGASGAQADVGQMLAEPMASHWNSALPPGIEAAARPYSGNILPYSGLQGASAATAPVTGMQMPPATFGNVVGGLGAMYGLGSGLAEGNWGQAGGNALSLYMLATGNPWAFVPAIGGTLLDKWI